MASLTRASANLGVVQQMEWEQSAAREAGLDWDVELWTTETALPGSVLRQVPRGMRYFAGRRLHFHRRLRAAARDYDRIVIRHAPLDPFNLFIPDRVRRKAWFVFHTKSSDYLTARGKRLGGLFSQLDRLFTRRAIGKTAGIIGVTEELVEYEKIRLGRPYAKSTVYPNGIFLTDWDSPIPDHRKGALKIIFIASRFFEWNGLETLLYSVANTRTDTAWELHLVGSLLPNQAAFIADHGLTDRIVIHGVLDKTAIAALMASMDLSLGAFALNKVKVRTACTLKVRESLGAGVPVYAGHSDVGVSDLPECYAEGSADWSAILAKADEARGRAKEDIRRAARRGIDKVALLTSLARDIS
jgi:glycosyltransferase involved in cell wall biosynthesis